MLTQLAEGTGRAVGFNQTMKAVNKGLARTVFLAKDADAELSDQVRKAAQAQGVQVEESATMKELGRACRIQVPCAAAALLKG